MRRLVIALSIAAVAVVLGGCAGTMSGLDGGSRFACKAPDGVTCSSLSGTYANAVANNLPALRRDGKGDVQGNADGKSPEIVGRAPSSGDPIRSQPKVLRIWLAPWEDSDGDLHDQSYIYVMADPGRWAIEHNQRRIIDRYRPTFIPLGQGSQAPKQGTPAPAPSTGGVVLPGAQAYGPARQAQSGEPE